MYSNMGVQGCSGDCTCLSPTLPEFDLGLTWLLVLYFALRGFSPGSAVFPSPQKSTFPNSIGSLCILSLRHVKMHITSIKY